MSSWIREAKYVEEKFLEQLKVLGWKTLVIDGVNLKDEYHTFKKEYNPEKFGKTEPKYKSLIIGDSYITPILKSSAIF